MGEIAKDQYDALQKEIIETDQNLKYPEKQAKDINSPLSSFTQATDKIDRFWAATTSAWKMKKYI